MWRPQLLTGNNKIFPGFSAIQEQSIHNISHSISQECYTKCNSVIMFSIPRFLFFFFLGGEVLLLLFFIEYGWHKMFISGAQHNDFTSLYIILHSPLLKLLFFLLWKVCLSTDPLHCALKTLSEEANKKSNNFFTECAFHLLP